LVTSKTVICRDLDGGSHEVPVSDLRWRPSAYAIIVHDGKVLLTKESGRYSLPGGGLELGELPEDGLMREIKEETGVAVKDPKLVGFHADFFTFTESKKGKYAETLQFFYRCTYVGGEITMDNLPEADRDDHEMSEWILMADIDTIPRHGRYDWRDEARKIAEES
jgi:ADP-ribose pyrophosphatase YjhB (NUDIX family)